MIKSGIVVVTEFCSASSSEFKHYIDYIDRDEAIRRDHIDEYSLFKDYLDYVGNPKKASGLFTSELDSLNKKQKSNLKAAFQTAQDNKSNMWQTVISFDNLWLKEHGMYDDKIGLVDEKKMIASVRGSVNAMLKAEGLEGAVWAADIHHNTGNIHIHVATVELNPTREKRQFIQYEKIKENGKWKYKKQYDELSGRNIKIPLKDNKGELIYKEEYVGKFKPKSLRVCKSKIYECLKENKENTKNITNIIREKLLAKETLNELYRDEDFKDAFVNIYNKLPKGVSNNLWKYNSNIMKPFRAEIDDLSNKYIKKYHKEDFEVLKRQLEAKSEEYKIGYGGDGNNYAENKLKDLYSRLGNQILRELRLLDERMKAKENIEPVPEETDEFDVGEPIAEEIISDIKGGYYEWSDEYKKARTLIFNTEYRKGIDILLDEARKGNALAISELGDCYKFGRGFNIDLQAANTYYSKALQTFKQEYEKQGKYKMKEYMAYRIGKMYNYGLGVSEDKGIAADWFEKASHNVYAAYSLAGLYEQGKGREKDMTTAIKLYKKAISMPYAAYKLGLIYEQGKGVTADNKVSQRYYSMVYEAFTNIEKEKEADDCLLYRLGVMEERGQGTERNMQAAHIHLKKASELGNVNAQYKLAKLYLLDGSFDKISTAINLLSNSAVKGNNDMAMYALGKIYSDVESGFYDIDKAIDWFERAAEHDNEYALFQLGKIYTSPEKIKNYGQKGIERFEKAAAKGNNDMAMYALGKIYSDAESGFYDIDKAIDWFEKAAEHDNEYALFQLGKIYTSPEKSKKHGQKGIEYFEKISVKGNPYSKLKLGLIYYRGEIASQDYKKALAYLDEANKDGLSFAGDIAESIREKDKRRVRSQGRKIKVIDKKELRMALFYLRQTMKMGVEHYLNMKKYEEMQLEKEQEEIQ